MDRPTFPDGVHCSHGYPPGEFCPACGEIPDPYREVNNEFDPLPPDMMAADYDEEVGND